MKESFTLNKSSWHIKMMEYIWNYTYSDFSYMCPYFWLSILNVFIFVPVLIVRSLYKVTSWAFLGTVDIVVNFLEKSREKKFVILLTSLKKNPELLTSTIEKTQKYRWEFLKYLSKHQVEYDSKFSLYWKLNEEYDRFFYRKRDEKYRKESEKYRKKEKAQESNREKIIKIVNFIRPIALVLIYTIGIIIALIVIYAIYWFIKFIIGLPPIDWVVILHALTIIGEDIVIIILAVILVLSVRWAVLKTFPKIFAPSKFWGVLGTPFVWFGKGIVTLLEILVAMYHNNCPPIDWES